MNENINKVRELGLYIHIPFCVKKCDYCDFLSAPASNEVQEEYFEALLTEIGSYRGRMQDYIIPTVFFGGGTPSSVKAEYIIKVMEQIREVFNVDEKRLEATIEVNPGTISREKLLAYQKAGINRLSFGLQSVDDKELKLLGRIHSYEQFKENYLLARDLGFQNINIDLMSALPGQTLASWENTLFTVAALNPEHISAYSLIVEEGTEFFERYGEGKIGYQDLPDEDTDRLMYHRTKEILKTHGYHRYEISNYAKIGYECAHNSSYWIGTEYLGLGLGASSLLDGARIKKMHDIVQYIQSCKAYKKGTIMRNMRNDVSISHEAPDADLIGIVQSYDKLSLNQRMEEFMFLGLRMCYGISKNAFYYKFYRHLEDTYGGVIHELENKKLLVSNGDNIRLTEFGADVSNHVFAAFLLD